MEMESGGLVDREGGAQGFGVGNGRPRENDVKEDKRPSSRLLSSSD